MRKRAGFYVLAIVFCGCALLLASSAQADTYMKLQRHTDSFTMMGKASPAKDEVTDVWMGGQRCRNDASANQSFILRADIKKMYIIDHGKKEYSEVDLPFDWNKMLPPEAKEMAEQMMQMFKMTAAVTDTGETKNIKGWNCRKYIVNLTGMMNANMEIWTTKDVKVDYTGYEDLLESTMSINPMFKDIGEEMKKIEGIRVSSAMTMNMMGADMKTTEELMEVSEKSPPAGTYEVPEGYTKVEFNPMMGRQREVSEPVGE